MDKPIIDELRERMQSFIQAHGNSRSVTTSVVPADVLDLLAEVDDLRAENTRLSTVCTVHAAQTHGAEAEELRKGIERILYIADSNSCYIEEDLRVLLDTVDSGDSLAFVERRDALMKRAFVAEAQLKALQFLLARGEP